MIYLILGDIYFSLLQAKTTEEENWDYDHEFYDLDNKRQAYGKKVQLELEAQLVLDEKITRFITECDSSIYYVDAHRRRWSVYLEEAPEKAGSMQYRNAKVKLKFKGTEKLTERPTAGDVAGDTFGYSLSDIRIG